MLKTDIFSNIQDGLSETVKVLRSNIAKEINFETAIKKNNIRKTYYLDTSDYDLNKSNQFLLRIRQDHDKGKYDTTLKCRHYDRYISAAYDLSSPKKNVNIKFEEDISVPFSSKFSLSASFKDEKKPNLNKLKDLKRIFPNLKLRETTEKKSLEMVNGFEPYEVNYQIGIMEFTKQKYVGLYLNLWYLANDIANTIPLIAELTFDYKAKSRQEQALLEVFPLSVVKKMNQFYYSLQSTKIVDFDAAKTKTEFAYRYNRNQ